MKYEYTGSQYLLHGDIGNGNTWLTITADVATTSPSRLAHGHLRGERKFGLFDLS